MGRRWRCVRGGFLARRWMLVLQRLKAELVGDVDLTVGQVAALLLLVGL